MLVVLPLAVIALLLAASVTAGVAVAVLLVGAAAATATYAKNRTDRHNAAVDRGEITVPPDPHLRKAAVEDLDEGTAGRLAGLGYAPPTLGRVLRFDGGWLVEKRGRELALVAGDDGGIAFYDPRWVPGIRAATEYRAGRGREPEAS